MVWGAGLSKIILNRICELVKRGVILTHSFKELHLQSVYNDVLDFTCIFLPLVRCTTTRGSGKNSDNGVQGQECSRGVISQR
jgi:hypothetical protein